MTRDIPAIIGFIARRHTMITPATAAPVKSPKRDKEADRDYARAMGIREASMQFHLISLCRYYTLDEVIEAWWKAQVAP